MVNYIIIYYLDWDRTVKFDFGHFIDTILSAEMSLCNLQCVPAASVRWLIASFSLKNIKTLP